MTKDDSTIFLDENNWTSTIAETNPLHDSTSSPNTLAEPLSQSSPENPLEVLSNSTLEDNIDLESQSSQYHLPPRSTRGIPPIRYEHDPKTKVKYPISDHVSSQKLSKSYASYVLQLSSVSIPSKIQEALADARWTKAIEEEIAALEKNGKIATLIIYVDDMVVTGDDHEEIESLQRHLASEFEMKQLGDLKYFLGIEVARTKNDATSTDKARYQRLVGKLIYLSHTRSDIAYAVCVVSQFKNDPRKPYMDAIERILRYLKSTPGKGLLFTKHNHLKVEGYIDADWAGSADNRRSTSGYFTFVGGNLVTWRSKKQPVVATSSAEAEYRGMLLEYMNYYG
ncbi:hypothetical protein UlMin_045498 [Ulmus minor]